MNVYADLDANMDFQNLLINLDLKDEPSELEE